MSELSAAPPAGRASRRLGGGTASRATGAPGRSRNGWTLVLAGLGAFMAALDVVVVATALPTLQTHLGASLADLEWTINAYNLVFGCLMLTGAALGDRFGRRRMYVLGLLVFVLGSAMAALSPGTGTLIAARVVQGAGAALLVPLTLTLISDAFPAEKRGAAIGIWGGITGLGVAAGPVVGGAIVQGISWQWIFWLNVPVGLAVAALSALRLRESRGPRPQLDFTGMALAGIALFALTWAPVRAPSAGWGSTEVIGSFVAGAVFLAGFLAWERRAVVPDAAPGLLPPPRLRHRERGDLLPVHLADRVPVLHHPAVPDRAGLLAAAGLACGSWSGWPRPCWSRRSAGALADKIGNRPFMVAGLVMQAAGLGWLACRGRAGGGLRHPGRAADHRGRGRLDVLPDRGQRRHQLRSARRRRRGRRHQQRAERAGGRVRGRDPGRGLRRPRQLRLPGHLHPGFRPAEWTAAAVAAAGVAAAVLAPPKAKLPGN